MQPGAQQIALTRAGQALVPRLAALAHENEEHFFGPMAAAERTALASALRALVRLHELRQVPVE